jgi:hypothetical protein
LALCWDTGHCRMNTSLCDVQRMEAVASLTDIHDAPASDRAGWPCVIDTSCQPPPAGMSGSALQHAACDLLQRLSQTQSSAELIRTAAPSALRTLRKHKRSAACSKATHHACQGVLSCAIVPSRMPTRNDVPPEPAALLRRRRAGPAPAGTSARGLRGRTARGSQRPPLVGPSLPGPRPWRGRGARAAPARAT